MLMVLAKPKTTKKKSWDSNNSNTEKEEKGHYISVRFPPFFILQEVIMNIKDCIDLVDNEKPNQYTIKEKVMWLSFIEAIIINEVLKTHEGYDGRYDMFEGYSEDKLTVKLIVPAPYDRLYTQYLKMKIDEANGEITRYNNSAALYNAYMSEYRKYYNKTHMPLDVTKKTKDIVIKVPMGNGLTDAEMENVIRELTFIITEQVSNAVSEDKIYDIVMRYMQNNTELFEGQPGEPGKDGDDGYSPKITVTNIENGHNVTIQDAFGLHSFDLKDGDKGEDGYTPKKGTDYYTEEDKQELIDEIKDEAVVNDDWNQNDETAPDYIKNRPFYLADSAECTVLEGGFVATFEKPLEQGKQLYYEYIAGRKVASGMSKPIDFNDDGTNLEVTIGDKYHTDYALKGIADVDSNVMTFTFVENVEYPLYIREISLPVPLPEKYIPESIARVSDVEEILDELHAYAQNLIGGDA